MMKVLITGVNGFIGKNLKIYFEHELKDELTILCFIRNQTLTELSKLISQSNFIIHLAGENRTEDPKVFYQGNHQLTETICKICEELNLVPILYASSIQVELNNDYGRSKELAEQSLKNYSERNKVPVFIYRLPNVFGKWCRPNYNSVIATWCYAILNNQEIVIDDKDKKLKLVYIDDVMESFKNCLLSKSDSGSFKYISIDTVYIKSLGEIADLLFKFKFSRENLNLMPVEHGFEKALYSTFLSYLPKDEFAYSLKSYEDDRGKFIEIFRMNSFGQVSISTSKPGVTRGQHFHHSKNEKFMVLKGKALIKFRRLCDNETVEYLVHDYENKLLDIPVGYTHNIENIGNEELVLLIWANEKFDRNRPDTYFLEV